jgi:hypothetical protein
MFVVGRTVESTSEGDFYIIQNLLRFYIKPSFPTRLMWKSLRLILLKGTVRHDLMGGQKWY